VIFCAALLRATLLARAPDLSDDVWRYLWDGSLSARGVSPYAFSPDDPEMRGAAPQLFSRLAHRDVRTVYPPVAQAAFRVFGGRGSLTAWKAFAAAADVSVVALLAAGAGGPGAGFAAALYAFHPLPITESAGEGHLDSVGIALLLASLSHLSRRRRGAAGIAFAMSVLTKYVSLAAAIPLLRKGGSKFLAAAALSSAVLWLAAAHPGPSPAGDLGQYATRWDFNSPLYSAAVTLMDSSALPDRAKAFFLDWKERLGHPAWTVRVFPYFHSAFFARALLGSALAVLLVAIAWRVRRLEAAVFGSLAALLLLSPTLHPWYLLWVLPFAAKEREPAFLYLSAAIPLSYALLYPIPGVSRGLILTCEYIPFCPLLLWTLRRRGRAAENPA
jgi:glycosyl transferase family 87